MIAADTSAIARYLDGFHDRLTTLLHEHLRSREAALPPIVLAELLSNPWLSEDQAAFIFEIPLLDIDAGFWARAGALRADLLRRGLKAKLADCLIAQSCIDNDAPLITYDRDFRHFERAGLRVI